MSWISIQPSEFRFLTFVLALVCLAAKDALLELKACPSEKEAGHSLKSLPVKV